MIARGGPQRPRQPVPGTMEWYAWCLDRDVERAAVRETRRADMHRVARMSRVLPKTTRRPRSAS